MVLIALFLMSLTIINSYAQDTQSKSTSRSNSNVKDKKKDRFKSFEIRVIRPKYLTKTFQFELGTQFSAIFSDTFIYTYLGVLNTTFHLNENIAIEASGAYGFSLFNSYQKTLDQDFNIKPIVHRQRHLATGALLLTPFYGKFQSLSDNLYYFDIFLSIGGGVTGVYYQYDHCSSSSGSDLAGKKPTVKNYSSVVYGLGQKIFISKKTAVRWDINNTSYWIDPSHGNCVTEVNEKSSDRKLKNYVSVRLGVSRFF